MLRLVVNPGTPHAWDIHLRPGTNSLGRSSTNLFQINDPSVSSAHCEITVYPDSVRIRDLGSTNGTFVDRAPVQESSLKPGQHLRLGSVEMRCESSEPARGIIQLTEPASQERSPADAIAPTTLTPSSDRAAVAVPTSPATALERVSPAPAAEHPAVVEPDSPVFCRNHYQNAARFFCAKCRRYLCDLCVNTRGMAAGGLTSCKICAQPVSRVSLHSHVPKQIDFFKSVWPAFRYPVRGDGWLLLFLGAFLFGFLDVAYYIALNAGKYGLLGMRGLMMRAVVICFILGTGYLFSYLKKIVYATASGEHRMPDWPELSEWQADILAPMYQFLIVSVISFGPAITLRIWYDGDHMTTVWLLTFLGCLYFPMGLLGVAMFDTLAALNPLFVIGSILKVPGPYAVAALVFTAILGFRLVCEHVLKSVLQIPLVPALISDLLAIFLLIVQTRILGLLYLAHKDTLGWFKRRHLRAGLPRVS